MLFMVEFEIFKGEGAWIALPVGIPGGGTQGESFEDAVRSAADWLAIQARHHLAKGLPFPECGFDAEPEYGGKMLVIAVDTSLADVPSVTAKDAAGLLGVSHARISQLCRDGLLDSWQVGRTRMVSIESIELRLAEGRGAGRPRRELVSA